MSFRIPGGECENNTGPIESESLILVDAADRAIALRTPVTNAYLLCGIADTKWRLLAMDLI
jgi:hypothetical protein